MLVLCLLLLAISNALPASKVNPLSDEFIETINSKQSTWKAGRNFHVDSLSQLHGLFGTLENPNKTLPFKVHAVSAREELSSFFDSRVQWGQCSSIRQIRDQASCASCWVSWLLSTVVNATILDLKRERILERNRRLPTFKSVSSCSLIIFCY